LIAAITIEAITQSAIATCMAIQCGGMSAA
jgi:hypothetical protein